MSATRKPIKWITNEAGCMLVTSHCKDPFGYIYIRRDNKTHLLHRYIYEQRYGTIPEGLVVRHKCDNPSCINHEHLILGTVGDNNRDRDSRNRTAKGENNGSAKLNIQQVTLIRSSQLSTRKLAAKFNVGQTTIQSIKKGIHWKHTEKQNETLMRKAE